MENRIIKFRGKTKDTGEWVEGFYYAQNIRNGFSEESEVLYVYHFIRLIDPNGTFPDVRILPETVGQFTGLTDKNGKEIYEGDRLKKKTGNREYEYTVDFVDGAFCLNKNTKDPLCQRWITDLEIIND